MRLVGVSSFAAPVSSNDINTNGSEYRFAGGYLAAAGTIGTLHFQMGTGGTATLATAYVYVGGAPGATLLYMSPEFGVAPGDNTVQIPGSLTAQTYSLGIQAKTGSLPVVVNSGSAANLGRQNLTTSFPYRNPPATMPAADVATGHEFIIWIDGTPSGTAYSLSAAPGLYSYAGGQSHTDYTATLQAGVYGYAGNSLLGTLVTASVVPDPPPYWPLMPGAKGRGRM